MTVTTRSQSIHGTTKKKYPLPNRPNRRGGTSDAALVAAAEITAKDNEVAHKAKVERDNAEEALARVVCENATQMAMKDTHLRLLSDVVAMANDPTADRAGPKTRIVLDTLVTKLGENDAEIAAQKNVICVQTQNIADLSLQVFQLRLTQARPSSSMSPGEGVGLPEIGARTEAILDNSTVSADEKVACLMRLINV